MNSPSNPNLPLAYQEGFAYFYGRKFLVTPATLIPRPETEDIIRLVIASEAKQSSQKILDIGTGTGIIPITLSLELKNISITATDISPAALKVAKQNTALHKVTDKTTFIKSDLFQNLQDKKYDIICANLPYVDKTWPWLDQKALAHEPAIALYTKDHGLYLIKKLIREASSHLAKKGHLLLEADPSQHKNIINYATTHHLTLHQTKNYILNFTKH